MKQIIDLKKQIINQVTDLVAEFENNIKVKSSNLDQENLFEEMNEMIDKKNEMEKNLSTILALVKEISCANKPKRVIKEKPTAANRKVYGKYNKSKLIITSLCPPKILQRYNISVNREFANIDDIINSLGISQPTVTVWAKNNWLRLS